MLKKGFLVVLVLLFAAVGGLGLCACTDKPTDKLPTTAYEKVGFAFNGVEKSFTSGADNAAPAGGSKIYGANMTTDEALDAIQGLFVDSDRETWNEQEQLDYNQPPMAQFRYLKAVFESIGIDYAFGTKYHDVVEGYMYFDPETGYRKDRTAEDANNYKYAYSIDFAMSINIDDNDLIFCEVSFVIDMSKGSETMHTQWYVSFDLKYDMKSTAPNYTLLMLTDNKEGDLTYRHEQGYEYDYVEVKDNAIVEWRKFFMDCKGEIVINAEHPGFEAYDNEGFYEVDTCKWYADGTYRKIKQMNQGKMQTLARAYVDGLGMNSTSINAAPFLAKTGVKSEAISAYYTTISGMLGEDLVYDLVCKDEDEQGGRKSITVWPTAFLTEKRIDDLVPSFATVSSTATYRVTFEQDQNGEYAKIIVTGATEADYEAFIRALSENGFIATGNGLYTLYLETDNRIVVVGINGDEVDVTVVDIDDNGGNGEENGPIGITYAADFTGAYEDYNKIQIDQGSVATMIETISGGAVTEKSIVTYVSGAGIHYEIALKAEDGMTAEQTAEKAESDYLDSLGDMPWFAQGMPVRYYTLPDGSNDIVIVVVGDVANGKPVLHIYVFTFTANSVREIAGAAQGGNGQGESGGNESGNGGKEEGGSGNESGSGGKEEGGSGNEGGQSGEESYIIVHAYDVGENGTLTEYTSRRYFADDRIEAWTFGDGWLLYTDEACTQPVDLNNPMYARGEDIDLYRKIERDFVSVTFLRFYNDAYCSGYLGKKTVVCRKGRVYEGLFGENSDFGDVTVYADIDKVQYLNSDRRYAFTENTTLYAFAENPNYTAYEIVSNGQSIMTVALDYVSSGSEMEFHSADGRHIKATVEDVNGKTITVSDVKKEFVFAQCYAFNGREMYRYEWYFTAEEGWGWVPAENVNYYTDATLSANVTYGDKITGNASVWQAYDEVHYRPNLEND